MYCIRPAISTSNIARFISVLRERGAAVSSDFAVDEARRNIELKRPAWAKQFQQLAARIEIVPSVQFTLPVELADKDAPILCTAIQSTCQALATGDKRFGHLYGQTVSGVQFVSLLQLTELLTINRS